MMEKPLHVFCCYAREDQPYLHEMKKHLMALQREQSIEIKADIDINPGTEWEREINHHLNEAHIILLLISADFIASNYCFEKEMQQAIARHDRGTASVVPVIIRPCDWQKAPFGKIQALPTNAQPIAKWSSPDEAFLDVVQGIRKIVEKFGVANSLPLSSPRITQKQAEPKMWNVPYHRNPLFTGRDDLLSQLHAELSTTRPPDLTQPQAISGLGGIGKTQLAAEYAYRYRQDYQAVLWVRADSRSAVISSFIAAADLLNLPERHPDRHESDQTIVNAVKNWLETHSEWLLILDNADELSSIVDDFIPHTFGGHILLTTRAQATGVLVQKIEVNTLKPDLGALLLLRRAKLITPEASFESVLPADRKIAREISQEMGGLPLALDQVGAYIEETSCSLEDYKNVYRKGRATLLSWRGEGTADYPETVATTWALSFQKVEQANPAAAELLRLFAFLHPDAIPRDIAKKGASYLPRDAQRDCSGANCRAKGMPTAWSEIKLTNELEKRRKWRKRGSREEEVEAKRRQEATRLHSERLTCPRRDRLSSR